jgi:hypothetical protein
MLKPQQLYRDRHNIGLGLFLWLPTQEAIDTGLSMTYKSKAQRVTKQVTCYLVASTIRDAQNLLG